MILDGRDRFYQWDLDRKLIVTDESIDEVHFCNRTDDCSLVCEVYQEGELRLVDVPNILLQNDWRINVYAFDGSYTKVHEVYEVERRTKPADYIYTETEIKNYDDLAARVAQIEENGVSDEAVESAVERYLDEHDIKVDLTGYATETYVDEKIEQIELTPGPEGPAGKDGKDGYTPVKGVDYFDGKDGADGKDGQDYVLTDADKREIAGMVEVTGGDVDLTDYYTKTETDAKIDEKIAAIEIPESGSSDHPVKAGTGTNSVMSLGASAASGQNAIALGNYASATGVNGVAIGPLTQASQLYSVAIGDTAKATHADAVAIGYNTITGAAYQTAMGKYNAADSSAVFVVGNGSFSERKNAMTIGNDSVAHFPGGVKVGADDAEVATKTYVDEAVAGAGGGSGEGADLSDYYTKDEVDNKIADIPVVMGTGANSFMSVSAMNANGTNAVAIGGGAAASAMNSVAIGQNATAAKSGQVVIGSYNVTDDNAMVIIGNGTSPSAKLNAMTVDANNVAHFPGNIKVGANDEEVATKAYVDAHAGSGGGSGSAVEEVYVGTEAPEDANIKIWVDTDDESEFATKEYVDSANLFTKTGTYIEATEDKASFAIGQDSYCEGPSQMAIGYKSEVTSSYSKGCASIGSKASCGGYEGQVALNMGQCLQGMGSLAANQSYAAAANQTTVGQYNIPDWDGLYYFIVGNGTSSSDDKLSNAFAVRKDGKAWVKSGIILTSPNGTEYLLTVADDGTLTTAAV